MPSRHYNPDLQWCRTLVRNLRMDNSSSSLFRSQHCRLYALLLGAAALATAGFASWMALTASPAAPSVEQDRLGFALTSRLTAHSAGLAGLKIDANKQRVLLRSDASQLRLQQHQPLSAVRYRSTSFRPTNRVLNMTVFCDAPSRANAKEFFAEPTWRCNNIRIGEQRLPFCESSPHAVNEQALNSHIGLAGRLHEPDYCGQLAQRKVNLFLLCGLLLREQARDKRAIPKLASSVKIPYGNCSLPERRRIILIGQDQTDAAWITEDFWNPGYVTDVLCSFALS